MDLPAFFARYPEFQRAGSTLVNAVLQEAALQLDQTTWGTLYDAGHGLLTAHLLAISPFGQQARLAPKDGVTTYWTRYRQLLEAAACGGAVASLGCPLGIPWG